MFTSFFLKRPFLPISLSLCTGLCSGLYLSHFSLGLYFLFASLCCLVLCVVFLSCSFEGRAAAFYCLFFVFYGMLIITFSLRYPEFDRNQTLVCEFEKFTGVSKPDSTSKPKAAVSAILLESGEKRIKERERALVILDSEKMPDWDFKDIFVIKGSVSENPDFPFSSYKYRVISSGLLEHRKTGSLFFSIVNKMKKTLVGIIEEGVPRPGSSVMIGMLTGDRQKIQKDVKYHFLRSGTSHILAVSGLHVGLLSGFVFLIFRMLNLERKITGFCLFLGVIWFYIAMTGFSISSVRAGIMISILTGSLVLGRNPDLINILCFSLLLMLMIRPVSLFEPSFQLSFAAMSAIIFYSRYLMFRRKRVKMELIPGFAYKIKALGGRFAETSIEYFKLSLVIWLFTSPIVLCRFDTFNMLTPLVNIPVVFLSTLIINAAFVFLPVAACSSLGVRLFGICGIFIKPLLWVADLFSDFAFDIEDIYLKIILLGFIFVCLLIIFLYTENITE